jgi:hypothetical protein
MNLIFRGTQSGNPDEINSKELPFWELKRGKPDPKKNPKLTPRKFLGYFKNKETPEKVPKLTLI